MKVLPLFCFITTTIISISLIVFLFTTRPYLIESLRNKQNPNSVTTSLEDSFCQFHDSDASAQNLNESCMKLTKSNCMNTKCCVWGQNSSASGKCYAGDKSGVTFKTDNNGNKMDVDNYYYLNKCYGNCQNKN
jgi:hypothetical protein|uniref:Uncharacterized protein n=1 Tax=viral metagenome TaxID=1070528 RepID=A0A6C0HE08_9ZZZZ